MFGNCPRVVIQYYTLHALISNLFVASETFFFKHCSSGACEVEPEPYYTIP